MWTISNNSNKNSEANPFMGTLSSCVNKVVTDGYRENFKVTSRGLYAMSRGRYYRPEQVQVINFYRFEAQREPSDNATMYVLETSDGLKGILIDSFITYKDDSIGHFIEEVEDIRKKINRHNQHFC